MRPFRIAVASYAHRPRTRQFCPPNAPLKLYANAPLGQRADVKAALKKDPSALGAYVSVDVEMVGLKLEEPSTRVGFSAGPTDLAGVLQFAASPADAPIIHCGGPLQITFYGDLPTLRVERGSDLVLVVDQWIAMSDAGNGLENFFDVYFPRAEKIVDFRHATEHLTVLAKLFQPGPAGEKLLSRWCHQLKHEGGTKLLARLAKLDRAAMDEPTQAEHDKVLTYFGNHATRMNYPKYLQRGWQIGSGSVESACKNVINQRLNMGGCAGAKRGATRWPTFGHPTCSDADQWDAFWSLAVQTKAAKFYLLI